MNIHDPFVIENVVREMTQEQRKKFKGTDKEFRQFIKERINNRIPKLLSSLRRLMVKHSFERGKHTKKYNKSVTNQVLATHRDVLVLLEAFLEFNAWVGETFYSKYRKLYDNYDDHLKIDTLIEIHTRACQVASEIKLLVTNGFADGAMARWRSLHELCSTFLFLYDNDHEVLQMYLDYEAIEIYDKMNRYDTASNKIGWRPIAKKVRKEVEDQRSHLIQKYGKEFSKHYGWTMKVLPREDRHIRGIEKSVEQDHLRGVYSWASENVHAGVSGNKKRLGLSWKDSKKLLRGPSPDGIFDPIQFTTYTLVEMSGTLLRMEDSALNNMYVSLLLDMQNLIVHELKNSRKSKIAKVSKNDTAR